MKLGAVLFVLSALAMTGCASSCPAPANGAQAPVVSTTRLTSVDLAETEYAPLVSKVQKGTAASAEEDVVVKDSRRHVGGGFSGYK